VRKDLLFLPEEVALIENLKNNDYINEEFSLLDQNHKVMPFEKKEWNFSFNLK